MFGPNDGPGRQERERWIEQLLALGDAPWDLDTLLELHYALTARSERIRAAAMRALMDIAERGAAPLTASPVAMIERFMFSFTAASCLATISFDFLIGLATPEARDTARRILEREDVRNEDFEHFVGAVVRSNDNDLIDHLRYLRLSKSKSRILNRALQTREE